jgi:hypothetical protein
MLAAGLGALAMAQAAPRAERRIAAVEARQGAASDGRFVYAIDDHSIGKYAIATGRRVSAWSADRDRFPHLNSCIVNGRELVCAASNYPALPQASSIEFFESGRLAHLRTINLGETPGSLTALDRHGGQWWAVFANYDGRGGQPGRDHRWTLLVRMDDAFRRTEAWTFPPTVLARLAPNSVSGASWTAETQLTVSGHNRPELYIVALPRAGSVLVHVATIATATRGQAFGWDPRDPKLLWSIDRKHRQIVGSRPRG